MNKSKANKGLSSVLVKRTYHWQTNPDKLSLLHYVTQTYGVEAPNLPELNGEAKTIKRQRERLDYTSKDGQALKVVAKGAKAGTRLVAFPDGLTVEVALGALRNGSVVHPDAPTVWGVGRKGYLAEGQKPVNKHTYSIWKVLLQRRAQGHADVDPSWYELAEFARWYQPRYEAAKRRGAKLVLESDLAVMSGLVEVKTYGPDTCFLLTSKANKLLCNFLKYATQVEDLLNAKTRRAPVGLVYEGVTDRWFLQHGGKTVATARNERVMVIEGLEFLSRLRLYDLLEEIRNNTALDTELVQQLCSQAHERLFGRGVL